MGWFGWITKGQHDISFLDQLIGGAELCLIALIVLLVFAAYWEVGRLISRWKRKGK